MAVNFNNKKNIEMFFLLMIISFVIFIPIWSFLLLSIICLYYKDMSKFIMFFALANAIFSLTFEPIFFSGADINSYFTYITTLNQQSYIFISKPFRYLFSIVYDFLGVKPQVYNLICNFIIYFCGLTASRLFAKKLNVNECACVIFTLIVLYKPTLYLSYEYTAAFCLFYLSCYYYLEKKFILAILLTMLSISLHLSMLIPFSLLLFCCLINKRLIIFSFFILIAFLNIQFKYSTFDFSFGGFLDYYLNTYIIYLQGPWSYYVGITEKIWFVFNIIVLSIFLYIFIKRKNTLENRILISFVLLSLSFITSRELSLRFTFGYIVFVPFIMSKYNSDSFLRYKIKKWTLLFGFIFFINVINFNLFRFLPGYIISNDNILLPLPQLFLYEYKKVPPKNRDSGGYNRLNKLEYSEYKNSTFQ